MGSDNSVSVGGAAEMYRQNLYQEVATHSEDSESESSGDDIIDTEEQFRRELEWIKDNYPHVTILDGDGGNDFIQNITNEEWKEIGRDISNNSHLEEIQLNHRAVNDENISSLFSGLTRSSSIEHLTLRSNGLGMAAVSSMVPFLRNANKLVKLEIGGNNIQSEGFNVLLRALSDSPIEELNCWGCGIESIEIDNEYLPSNLTLLHLAGKNINADGCREITKLLQGRNSVLERLYLNQNNIDDNGVAGLANALRSNTTLVTINLGNNKVGDEGVSLLVDALQHNTSLKTLQLGGNDISDRGETMLLKLVNDISSIKATLQSNHTLTGISLVGIGINLFDRHFNPTEIDGHINTAIQINANNEGNPEGAGREKVIQTQLHSTTRAKLAELQGVSHSLYSEINPLRLPEVLSLVGRQHGQGELFDALKSSIAGVISVVDRKHLGNAKSAEPHTKRMGIEEGEGAGNESCSNKRRRN